MVRPLKIEENHVAVFHKKDREKVIKIANAILKVLESNELASMEEIRKELLKKEAFRNIPLNPPFMRKIIKQLSDFFTATSVYEESTTSAKKQNLNLRYNKEPSNFTGWLEHSAHKAHFFVGRSRL